MESSISLNKGAVLRKNCSLGIVQCWTALKAVECLRSAFPSPFLRGSPTRGSVKHGRQEPHVSPGTSYLEGCACRVAHVGQDLYRFFEHDPECVSSAVTTESSIILSQGLFFLVFNDLWFLKRSDI